MREPAVVCPGCETAMGVVDLAKHAPHCAGPREPHPFARWAAWNEVVALGIPAATLSTWISRGRIRWRGDRRHRQYLLRDAARAWAQRNLGRRPDGRERL